MTDTVETSYLVVGAGATTMVFVDSRLTKSDATVTMVDRHHRPGGHWSVVYPLVKLHQPSEFYGVESRELSAWRVETEG